MKVKSPQIIISQKHVHRFIGLMGFLGLLFGNMAFAQLNLSGYVLGQDNAPIVSASVFIKETSNGTATDANGRYFLTLNPGSYTLLVSSIGYQTQTVYIVLQDKDLVKNIFLETSIVQIEELVISAKRKDPAYEIMQAAIENKEKFSRQIQSERSKLYIKATEKVENRVKVETVEDEAEFPLLPDEKEEKSFETKTRLNMVELELIFNYQKPDKYKEERTAYASYGDRSGLFIPRFNELDFNFYNNLVYFPAIAQVPVVSPLSTTAILTYKFKLEESYRENEQLIYKIKVIPRKEGNSSVSGYIYINDGIWNIHKLELEIDKGSLKVYDKLTLKQGYSLYNDSIWLVSELQFAYETKSGRFSNFKGETVVSFLNREIDYVFPNKFFGAEIAVTTSEAYERDSSYWNLIRPEKLNKEEDNLVRKTDSIRAITQSQEYKDSLEALYNKITLAEIVYDGLGFRKGNDKYLFLSSLASLTNFQVVGGWRFGPYVSYFKRWESGRYISTQNYFSYGLKNNDLQGNAGILYRYNPMKFADIRFYVGRFFSTINYFDAFLNQLSVSNYILVEHAEVYHRIELLNGLFVSSSIDFDNRKSIENLKSKTFLDNITGNREVLSFEGYQALISDVRLSYTPKQQYITEPNRKIIVNSKYPTFTLRYKKGWENILKSDVNFDYFEFSIYDRITMGIFGQSIYNVSLGGFANIKGLKFIDYKRFRQSDPIWYSDPLFSFQLLDTSLAITKPYIEGHYIHHFNGALINNIPLLKKTRIMAVAGAGALWVTQPNYRYAEVFAGVERIFKLGPRRRLKLGVYGVLGESSQIRTKPGFKISADIIDTWKTDWSF